MAEKNAQKLVSQERRHWRGIARKTVYKGLKMSPKYYIVH